MDGLGRLAQRPYVANEDGLNLELFCMVLNHAARPRLSSSQAPDYAGPFRSGQAKPRREPFALRPRNSPACGRYRSGLFHRSRSWWVIEPLVLSVVVPAAIPYLHFEWNLTRNRYEAGPLARVCASLRTRYFVAGLADSASGAGSEE